MDSSDYLNSQRRNYALHVLSERAIPHAADGLKPSGRRCLWVARNGNKSKTATLAGEAMRLHPHAPPTGAIDTLTGPYLNNIPLFKGIGTFGTLLNPRAIANPRYTSVKVSNFTKDVIFKDIEIIPMQKNYDESLDEPKHFLPLVPVVLLNPQEGIAIGFASSILPRELEDIISAQIHHLQGKEVYDVYPSFIATDNYSHEWFEDSKGKTKWVFNGSFEKVNTNTVKVTNLPYGMSYEKYIDFLNKAEENLIIKDYEDNSRDVYDIDVKLPRATLSTATDEEIINILNLQSSVSENLNIIKFDGEHVWSTNFVDVIKEFTDWRLQYYTIRYERLIDMLNIDIQKYNDILTAIRKNVGGVAKKVKSKDELRKFLVEIGIVHVEYILTLPVYRFTEDEKKNVEQKKKDALVVKKEYNSILKSEKIRKNIYIDELKEVLRKYKKGYYTE